MQLYFFVDTNLDLSLELGYHVSYDYVQNWKIAFFFTDKFSTVLCFLIAVHILNKDTMFSFLTGSFSLIAFFFFFPKWKCIA